MGVTPPSPYLDVGPCARGVRARDGRCLRARSRSARPRPPSTPRPGPRPRPVGRPRSPSPALPLSPSASPSPSPAAYMGDPDAVSQKAGIAIGMPDRSIRHERDPDDFDVVTRVVVSGDTCRRPAWRRRGRRAPAPDKGGAGAAAAAAAAAASSSSSSSSVDGVLAPRLCTICYDEVRTCSALVCGHAFCNTCYHLRGQDRRRGPRRLLRAARSRRAASS